jgi:predicted GH43/DUF377 family glycosyl hydrolase
VKGRHAQPGDEPLIRRHSDNPILTAASWPYRAHAVFNPGATRLADGTTLLLCRVEDYRGHSHLCAARSANGVDRWSIDPAPTLFGDPEHHPEELWGIEDARITFLPDRDEYIVTYTAFSRRGPGVALALTKDFRQFERLGLVLHPDNKDAAVLPRRIGGAYAMLHRPKGASRSHVWMSFSHDLHTWDRHTLVLKARRGGWWDANKIGLSPPPIETPEGWLLLYHGVRITASGALYRLGVALLDLDEPQRVLARGDEWIFGPEAPYERVGDVGNVAFPCGVTIGDDGDSVNLYYGAADTCIGLATTSVQRLLNWVRQYPGE